MKIAVVGDTLLDIDVAGRVERLSPEAPVPVVEPQTRLARAGGAGLVARLAAHDGHDVRLLTGLGEDEAARTLRTLLGDVRLLACPTHCSTPVKTRIAGNGVPIARVDRGGGPAVSPHVAPEALDALDDADAIVVADYGRGMAADAALRERLGELAQRIPVVWDPHPRGPAPVAGSAVATPNLSEAWDFAQRAGDASEPVPASPLARAEQAARRLVRAWRVRTVAVTLGPRGTLVVRAQGAARGTPARSLPFVAPAHDAHPRDTCGAGDRFASALAGALAEGRSVERGVEQAVRASTAFLARGGVASLTPPASRPRRVSALPRRSDDGVTRALEVAQDVRRRGGTVVATGGCFDLLHAGHAHTLAAARALGDCLIVCVNSDASVRRLKGSGRPYMPQRDRVELLEALGVVDAVLVFNQDTPEQALRLLRPDIWAKGGDYGAAGVPEAAVVREWGATSVTLPYYRAHSTSRLADAIRLAG